MRRLVFPSLLASCATLTSLAAAGCTDDAPQTSTTTGDAETDPTTDTGPDPTTTTGDGDGDGDGDPFPDDWGLPPAGCTVDPSADALLRPGVQDDGSVILVNGRRTQSAGASILFEGLGVDAAVHPTADVAYITTGGRDDRYLYVIDRGTQQIVQQVNRGDAFYGMVVSPDGSRLYASNGVPGGVEYFDIDQAGMVTSAGEVPVVGWTAGMALTPDGATLYVASFDANRITEIDAGNMTITRTFSPGFQPWDLLYLPTRGELWATEFAEDRLAIYDLGQDALAQTLTLPTSPAMLATNTDESKVWVSVSGADTVVEIDPVTRTVVTTASVAEDDFVDAMGVPLPNSNPGVLTYDAVNERLFVTRGSDSAIGVLDAASLDLLGSIPTGWYPTDAVLSPDGSQLIVPELRANGTRSNSHDPDEGVGTYWGGASFIDLDNLDLTDATNAVVENFRRPLDNASEPECGADFPLPLDYSGSPVIEHVILIVNENQTFDALFGASGDELGVEADPAFLKYETAVTVNKRALAQRFVIADNFYTDSEESDSGHTFLTSTHWTEFVERIYKDRDKYDVLGFYPTSEPAIPDRGNFFSWVLDNGKTLQIYGEIVGLTHTSSQGPIAQFADPNYPGGLVINYDVKDEVKANYVAAQIQSGVLADFTFLSLPNDHGQGVQPNVPTPPSMAADTDYGVGIVVDALSHSEFWDSTVVIVLQDDPQGSDDHIDENRSPLLVISPWVRTGYVSKAHYSFSSVFATIERLLGIPPLGRPDAGAAPMYDVFTDQPNLAAYDAIPREYPEELGNASDPGVHASRCMDFRGPDRNPGLGIVVANYLAFRRGELTAAEADARIAAALADPELIEEAEEEAEEELSAHALAVAEYRELAKRYPLPALVEAPARLGPAKDCK